MEAERKKAEEEERKRSELEKAKQVGKYHLIILCLFLIYFFCFNNFVEQCSSGKSGNGTLRPMLQGTLPFQLDRAKISHLVESLPTSRQQVVFALLVPSCQQVWNKLLTTCNKLDGIIRLVTRLFQQV